MLLFFCLRREFFLSVLALVRRLNVLSRIVFLCVLLLAVLVFLRIDTNQDGGRIPRFSILLLLHCCHLRFCFFSLFYCSFLSIQLTRTYARPSIFFFFFSIINLKRKDTFSFALFLHYLCHPVLSLTVFFFKIHTYYLINDVMLIDKNHLIFHYSCSI